MQQPLIRKYFKMEDHFRSGNPEEYDLFIELAAGVSSFAIVQHQEQRLAGLASFENPLFPVLDEFPWLKKSFHSVKIAVQNTRYTLIPTPLYLEDEKAVYTGFTLDPSKEKENILSDRIDPLEIHNVFAVPSRFHEKLVSALPQAVILHHAGILIRSFWLNYRNTHDKIFLNVRNDAFDLLIFDNHLLQYCNSFYFQAPEDLVYYLIFVMEQLELDPEKVMVSLAGEVDKDHPVYSLIERYIRFLKFTEPVDPVKSSTLFEDIPPHRFFSLLNMKLCGS